MRHFINLVENPQRKPTREELARKIYEVARSYMDRGWAPNTYEINNGLCEDLANEVVDSFVGSNETEDFMVIDAYNLTVDGDGDTWDIDLLSRYWPKCSPTHGLEWKDVLYEIPSHVWIVLDGRHYDAECTGGVENFFELPLIRRGMERISAKKRAISEGVWDTVAPRYDSKPAYMVPMEDEANGELFPVWGNPSRNTFTKILQHVYGQARAILYRDGTFLIWDTPNLYHSDVYNHLTSQFGNDFITLTCGPDYVAVKSEDMQAVPFTDPEWLPVLEKTFARYYPAGVKFEQFNWF